MDIVAENLYRIKIEYGEKFECTVLCINKLNKILFVIYSYTQYDATKCLYDR